MIALLYSKLSDPQFMAMILVGIAAAATVFTVACRSSRGTASAGA
jgi:hypothetical protein